MFKVRAESSLITHLYRGKMLNKHSSSTANYHVTAGVRYTYSVLNEVVYADPVKASDYSLPLLRS